MNRSGLLVLVAALAGCDPFPSYDGFVRPDAGAVTADAGNADDAGSAADAAPDASDAGDPCTGATFCDRFERSGDVQGPWSSNLQAGGGTVRIDGDDAVSPTRSAKMNAPTSAQAYLRRMETGEVRAATLGFWLKTSRPTANEAIITRVGLFTGAPGARVWLSVGTTGMTFLEARYDGSSDRDEVRRELPQGTLREGAWQRWTITLDAQATPARARVEVDGTVALDVPLSTAFVPGNLIADLGVVYNGAPASIEARVDDAALTAIR